jgi:hypothetical protein
MDKHPRPKRNSNPRSSLRVLKTHALDREATGSATFILLTYFKYRKFIWKFIYISTIYTVISLLQLSSKTNAVRIWKVRKKL